MGFMVTMLGLEAELKLGLNLCLARVGFIVKGSLWSKIRIHN